MLVNLALLLISDSVLSFQYLAVDYFVKSRILETGIISTVIIIARQSFCPGLFRRGITDMFKNGEHLLALTSGTLSDVVTSDKCSKSSSSF